MDRIPHEDERRRVDVETGADAAVVVKTAQPIDRAGNGVVTVREQYSGSVSGNGEKAALAINVRGPASGKC